MNSTAVGDRTRCPDCGGLNASDARWCGQCLRPFGLAPIMSTARRAPSAAGPVPDAATGRDDTAAPASAASSDGRAGGFALTGDGITWTCAVCESVNGLQRSVCMVCGSSLAETLRSPAPARPKRDPGTAALLSLFLPGAGHAYLGMWPDAVARAVVGVWVVAVSLVTAMSGRGAAMTSVAAAFGVASFALWGATAHDAFREANHQPALVLVRGRTFLYCVLALLFLLFVALSASAVSLQEG